MLRTLRSREELLKCREQLRMRGVDFTDQRRLRIWRLAFCLRYRHGMPVPDVQKSWDVWNALALIEDAKVDRLAPVLDMGCYNSEILYVLHTLGYRELHGCDLNPLCRRLPFWHRIQYRAADITCTPYASRSFAAITCLSVIEHGVPAEGLAQEVARLLRPGGIFVLTTDFDPTGERHVIPRDLKPFGLDWQIYSLDGLVSVLTRFERAGLTLLDPDQTALKQPERPVSWSEHTYTFALAALQARGE